MTRMKRPWLVWTVRASALGILAAVTMVVASCQKESPSGARPGHAVETELRVGETIVRDIVRDPQRRVVSATLISGDRRRRMQLAASSRGSVDAGVAVRVTAPGGAVTFEVDMAWDERSQQLWVEERAGGDVLTLWRRVAGGRVSESYDINGDRLALEFPDLDDAVMDKLATAVMSGRNLDGMPPEALEVGARMAEFQDYYVSHTSNALHHNADGDMAMAVISDPAFADAVTSGDDTPQRITDPAGRTCWIALKCVAFKCRIGGLANPLCVACGGTALTCIIAEVGCWLAGCDGPF